MTLTALIVLAAGLATSGPGTAASARRSPAAPIGAVRDRSRDGVTCTLRIVHAPEAIDAGMLAPQPARRGSAGSFDDGIVRDSVSPCAGATTRSAAGTGAEKRFSLHFVGAESHAK